MEEKVTKGQEHKLRKVMREFKAGKLTSGKGGPAVTDPKQAVAIAYSEARKEKSDNSPMKRAKGDSPKAMMKRKKQLGDSMF